MKKYPNVVLRKLGSGEGEREGLWCSGIMAREETDTYLFNAENDYSDTQIAK